MEKWTVTSFLSTIEPALPLNAGIVAAWLIGSFGRGDQDQYSDIDLCVVVSDPTIIQDWFKFVSQFGELANAHEAKQNAPQGGTMASVLYTNGVTIDWMLIPQEAAILPRESRLLFEKITVPLEQTAELNDEEKQAQLDKSITFFWMMAAVAAKSVLRQHDVRFHVFLNVLFWTKEEIADLVSTTKRPYRRFSDLKLMISQEEQTSGLIGLCEEVARLCDRHSEPAFDVIKKMLDPN